MRRLGLSMGKVKAIFISHEHYDHIKGVDVICKRYNVPVYITNDTLKNSGLKVGRVNIREFRAHESISIGELSVLPFPKFHDGIDPYSFVVSGHGVNIGVFTDIGAPCDHLKKHFKMCHAAFLESNYDHDMLMNGDYPEYLKRRIAGDKGHLSNAQALELFLEHKADHLSLVLLAHLSKENNDPQLAKDLFMKHAGDVEVVVASRYEETEVFTITAGESTQGLLNSQQMSLF